jgi:serine phosphatase RsbU (regulator of sigma subunit)
VIWRVWRASLSERRIVQLSIALIVADGLLGVLGRAAGIPYANLFMFWLIHLVACCVFPWSVRQALIPLAIVVGVSQVSLITVEGKGLYTLFNTALFLLMCGPAVFICWFRHSQRLQRSSHKFLRERYGMLRQELAYARQIHEAVFPEPKRDGAVRYVYQYQPMRQIGGDFLFVQARDAGDGHEIVSVVVMDVTGHGIPAALSVNRLHGEIELRFADDPDISPGEVLERLNRYVYLTMAKHSLFVTALCLRVDTRRGVVEWASGGHPPAFLRGVDGTVRELNSTAFVLGACSERDFDPVQESCAFHPGDSIIAYTDGASEARDTSGKMVRISGLRSMVASGGRVESGSWPDRMIDLVTAHRGGLPSEDDTLVIELYRPLGSVRGEEAEDDDEVAAGAGVLSP